jgi:hypothetical protein
MFIEDSTIGSKIGSFFGGSVGFLLHQYIIENNILIKSYERELNNEEKETLAQRNRIKEWSESIVELGNNPDELEKFTKQMIAKGRLKREDLEVLSISDSLMERLFDEEDDDNIEEENENHNDFSNN